MINLDYDQAQTMKLFYSAAVCMQRKYSQELRSFQGARWKQLPDLFSDELGLRAGIPDERLKELASIHVQRTGVQLNWAGTYENAARQLLHRWELEQAWKR